MSKLNDQQLLTKCADIVARQRATMEVLMDQNSTLVPLAETVLATLVETADIVHRRKLAAEAAELDALWEKLIRQYRRRGQLIDSIPRAHVQQLAALAAEYGEQQVHQCLELSRNWQDYCRAVLWNRARGGPTVDSLADALRLLRLWNAQ